MGGWLALVPRKVQFVVLGAILAAGALFWAHHAGYNSGRLDERLTNDRAKVKAAEETRGSAGVAVHAAVAAAQPIQRRAAALHDTVRVVDTATVVVTLPALAGSVSTKQTFEIPAVVVRRIVQDSLSLLAKDGIIAAQAVQLQADTTVIDALKGENKTLTDMKTPTCGAKCKVAVAVVKVAIVAEATVRIVRWLKPRH